MDDGQRHILEAMRLLDDLADYAKDSGDEGAMADIADAIAIALTGRPLYGQDDEGWYWNPGFAVLAEGA